MRFDICYSLLDARYWMLVGAKRRSRLGGDAGYSMIGVGNCKPDNIESSLVIKNSKHVLREANASFYWAMVGPIKNLPCEMRSIFHWGLRPSVCVCG